MTDSDAHLLERFVRQNSQDAFAELVKRHLNLVYSAALRQVRSPQLAEEVAQSAFTDLSRIAGRLKPDTILTAWLYQVTRRTAIDVVRRESRRQLREQIATEMNAINATPSDWAHIEPLLDEAVSELDEADRAAVLLRYFENKSLREVGQQLGVSDDAAQKRVSRAVERLREFFSKRGAAVGASGLVVVISANAVQAAPVGLALTISTAAAVTGSAVVAAAAATTIKTITMTTLQKAIAGAAIVAVGVTAPLAIQHQKTTKLREENHALRLQVDQVNQLRAENERLSNAVAAIQTAQARPDAELLRLRNEVGQLRQQTNDLAKLQAEIQRLSSAGSTRKMAAVAPSEGGDFPRETWAFAGYADPESAVKSLAWSALSGNMETFLNSLTPEHQAKEKERWKLKGQTESEMLEHINQEFARTRRIRILNKETVSENELILSLFIEGENGRSEAPRMKLQRINNEWKMAGSAEGESRSSPK